MIDKFLYNFFGALDNLFEKLDNIFKKKKKKKNEDYK
jgi:hypothetical protein